MGREDFEKALTQCSIVIIPSLYESFSIAAYQALIAGKGVIITEQSPWNRISKENKDMPIVCCRPLLKDTDYEELNKLIKEIKLKLNSYEVVNVEKIRNMVIDEACWMGSD